jgi:hypothetical protein
MREITARAQAASLDHGPRLDLKCHDSDMINKYSIAFRDPNHVTTMPIYQLQTTFDFEHAKCHMRLKELTRTLEVQTSMVNLLTTMIQQKRRNIGRHK